MIRVLRAELGEVDNVEIEQVDAMRYDLRMAAQWRGDADHRVRQPAVSHRVAADVQGDRRARGRHARRVHDPEGDGGSHRREAGRQGVRRARRDDPDVLRRHDGAQGRRGLVRAGAEDRLDGDQDGAAAGRRSRASDRRSRSTTRRSSTPRSASAARRCATRCARSGRGGRSTPRSRRRASTASARGETLDIAEFGALARRCRRPRRSW